MVATIWENKTLSICLILTECITYMKAKKKPQKLNNNLLNFFVESSQH